MKRKFIKKPITASNFGHSHFKKSSTDNLPNADSFWSLDVSGEGEVKEEIEKAFDVGATLHDIEDYLYELYSLQIITDNEFSNYLKWSESLFK